MAPRIAYVALFCLALGSGIGWKINGWKMASEAAEVHEATQKAIIDTLMAYDKEKTAKEEVKRENVKVIDAYRRELAGYKLRLSSKSCPGDATETTASQSSSARPLPTGNDAVTERFTTGLAELALSADRIVEDCRARN